MARSYGRLEAPTSGCPAARAADFPHIGTSWAGSGAVPRRRRERARRAVDAPCGRRLPRGVEEGPEQVEGQREDDGRVLIGAHFEQGLQVAQVQRRGLAGDAGISTSLISTVVTLMPQGSVCSSMIF
jgi:hypothetical protein